MFPYSAGGARSARPRRPCAARPQRTSVASRTTNARSRRRASSASAGVEPLGGVLVHRLEHPVALAVEDDEALVDERLQRVEVGVAHLLGGVERAAAGEDRETAEQAPLVVGEQLVRPVERGAERLLARARVAAAAQQVEAPAEPLEDLRRARARSSARRRARPRAAARRGAGTARRSRPTARGRERAQKRSTASAAASGGRRYSLSACTCRRSREVTSSASPGHSASSDASSGAASTTCSMLSSTSSSRRSPMCSARLVLRAERLGDRRRARTRGRAGPRGRPRTRPPGTIRPSDAAASIASRVLPAPPGPVSVTSRAPPSIRARTSASSRSRPTNALAGRGRFVFAIVASGGKLSPPSWKSATAPSTSFEPVLAELGQLRRRRAPPSRP